MEKLSSIKNILIGKPSLITVFFLCTFSSSLLANNTWTLVGDLKNPRSYHSATALNDSQILITGGSSDSTQLNSAEIFSINDSQWQLISNINQARQNHAAILLDDGNVLITGGSNSTNDLSDDFSRGTTFS